MRNDLISRSVLLNKMREHTKKQRYLIPEEIWGVVENAPAAYDVDKGVEQLEEEAKYNQSEANELAQRGDYGTAARLEGIAQGYRYSVDIVKSGGIEQH